MAPCWGSKRTLRDPHKQTPTGLAPLREEGQAHSVTVLAIAPHAKVDSPRLDAKLAERVLEAHVAAEAHIKVAT
jgi:hypothetical protein